MVSILRAILRFHRDTFLLVNEPDEQRRALCAFIFKISCTAFQSQCRPVNRTIFVR